MIVEPFLLHFASHIKQAPLVSNLHAEGKVFVKVLSGTAPWNRGLAQMGTVFCVAFFSDM